MRATPEDFVVREWLGFERRWRRRSLAVEGPQTRREHDVGREAAGQNRQDPSARRRLRWLERSRCRRRAVIHRAGAFGGWTELGGRDRRWLRSARAPNDTRRKLKRGALKGNDFVLVLREFAGDAAVARAASANIRRPRGCRTISVRSVSVEAGTTSTRRISMVQRRGPAPERAERGFALSAARAAIFNAVLAERVTAGTGISCWTAMS